MDNKQVLLYQGAIAAVSADIRECAGEGWSKREHRIGKANSILRTQSTRDMEECEWSTAGIWLTSR